MALERVAPEELGEAILYVMGDNVQITRKELLDRVARFYRHERLSEGDVKRVYDAVKRLVAAGFLTASGADFLRRPL